MSDRQELIRNALAFLSDPNTRHHPLAQRIAFLESKGLTNAEIEQVLQQSASSSTVSQSTVPYGSSPYAQSVNGSQYTSMIPQPPSVPQRDWRDYFIMAVVSGGVMFGLVSLARKYLMPHLKPPSSTAYESDRDELTAQFDAAAALIKDIQADTASARTLVDEQREKVDNALDKLQIAINETKEAETRTKSELRDIREEVSNVRDMLPKMLEKNKDAQSQALLDLQQELKSLKALLLSRGPSFAPPALGGFAASGTPSPSTPTPRPSIPAWQLAAPAPASAPAPPAPRPFVSPTTATEADVAPTAVDKGKGKDVDPLASSGVLVDHEDEVVS